MLEARRSRLWVKFGTMRYVESWALEAMHFDYQSELEHRQPSNLEILGWPDAGTSSGDGTRQHAYVEEGTARVGADARAGRSDPLANHTEGYVMSVHDDRTHEILNPPQ